MNYHRAVRAMNETLKQNRLLRERGEDGSFTHPSDDRNSSSDLQKNVCFNYPRIRRLGLTLVLSFL